MIALPQVFLHDIKKSFEGAHLDAKNYQNLLASLWNSTTVTTLVMTFKKRLQFFYRHCFRKFKTMKKYFSFKQCLNINCLSKPRLWTRTSYIVWLLTQKLNFRRLEKLCNFFFTKTVIFLLEEVWSCLIFSSSTTKNGYESWA